MSKWFFSLFFSLFLVSSASAGDFVVKEYLFGSTLKENNIALVHEKITVEFSQKRHGIYRIIPFKNYDNIYKVKVYRNSREEKFRIERGNH